ncbi:MAG TPA: sigma-70 family RNA polymerase sigma factor [Candidatus Acidoferrales bacterium]
MADAARAFTWGRDEAELITELQVGSEEAFDWLVTHHQALVYNLLLSMLGNPADAADATQEVFLRAYRGMPGFRRGSSLKTWLYRIAIRQALNQRRWWCRHQRQETSLDAEPENGTVLELESAAATPFEELAATEAREVVERGLAAVPEVFRSAVVLRDLEGLSYEEVAEVLDVSVGTVKSRILRGRQALRVALTAILDPASSRDSASAASFSRSAPMPSVSGLGGGE